MVLVHDLDLARISGICDSNVKKHHIVLVSSCLHLQSLEPLQPDVVENHLQGSNAEIHTDLCRKRTLVLRFLPFSRKTYKDLSPVKNDAINDDPQIVRVAMLSMITHKPSE